MKILLIEDDKMLASILIEEIEECFGNGNIDLAIEQVDITEALSAVDSFNPDVVILDIFTPVDFHARLHGRGANVANKIISQTNCFLIIFTGYPEILENIDDLRQHDSVEIVAKGSDSLTKVISCLNDFYFSS